MNAPLPQAVALAAGADTSRLFQPGRIGDIAVANRVVMAPLTRSRADEPRGDIPGSEMNVEYYRQRSNAGLIISEGTQVAPAGKGYMATPGIYSDAQVDGWRRITDAVHAAGSKIVAQLWHVGRITHPALNGGFQPLAPSAVAPQGVVAYTHQGKVEVPVPQALSEAEIAEVVEQFRRGAANAMRAGFDGVEIHGANGYLIQQFLSDNSNQRTDQYGGSHENRVRFAVEVATAVSTAIGADRVGIRFSPGGKFHDMNESDPEGLYTTLLNALNPLGLAYLHILETASDDVNDRIREIWTGPLIVNPAIVGSADFVDKANADRWLARGGDLIAFGRYFISNPDLVRRLRDGLELTMPDLDTFYSGGDKGYIDYPEWSDSAVG